MESPRSLLLCLIIISLGTLIEGKRKKIKHAQSSIIFIDFLFFKSCLKVIQKDPSEKKKCCVEPSYSICFQTVISNGCFFYMHIPIFKVWVIIKVFNFKCQNPSFYRFFLYSSFFLTDFVHMTTIRCSDRLNLILRLFWLALFELFGNTLILWRHFHFWDIDVIPIFRGLDCLCVFKV